MVRRLFLTELNIALGEIIRDLGTIKPGDVNDEVNEYVTRSVHKQLITQFLAMNEQLMQSQPQEIWELYQRHEDDRKRVRNQMIKPVMVPVLKRAINTYRKDGSLDPVMDESRRKKGEMPHVYDPFLVSETK